MNYNKKELLYTGLALAGFGTSLYCMYDESRKFEKREKNIENIFQFKKTIIFSTLTIGSIILNKYDNMKYINSLSAAYLAAKDKEYDKNLNNLNISDNRLMKMESTKEELFFEPISGKYFESNIHDVKNIERVMNNRIKRTGRSCLNDLFLYLGQQPIDKGYDVIWFEPINIQIAEYTINDDIDCYFISINHKKGVK